MSVENRKHWKSGSGGDGFDSFVPLDKQAQQMLISKDHGAVWTFVPDGSGGSAGRYSVDFVDRAPLPSESPDEANDESCANGSVSEINPGSNHLERVALEVMVPVLEDIFVPCAMARRYSRANSNKSVNFKLFHLYRPDERNAPELAVKMRRNRAIPERYAHAYGYRKETYRSSGSVAACSSVLQRDLPTRIRRNGAEDGVLDLYAALKSFLAALVAASPWDSVSSFDICRELYVADGRTRGYKKAIRQLEENGCSVEQISEVVSLIAKCKKELEV